MKNTFSKSHTRSSKPREERRKELILRNRKENLIYLWRIIFYITTSWIFGYILISRGWSPITQEHIKISGNRKISSNTVITNTGFSYPKLLFDINPKELKKNLKENLPILNANIQRSLFPPELNIKIRERDIIAYAIRTDSKGKRKGVIDINANWVPIKIATKGRLPTNPLIVEGWRPRHKKRIATVLKYREKIGSGLTKIIFSPDGELNIRTKEEALILLGRESLDTKKQLEILFHLNSKLPLDIKSKGITIIDIRDPTKPELQLPKPNN